MQVAVDMYRATTIKELKWDFWATGQIRGAAMLISSNIAEGFEYNMKYLRKFEKGRNNLWNHPNHSNSSS